MAESRTQRRGLGRGLGSLIPSTSAPETEGARRRRRRGGASRGRRVGDWPRCAGASLRRAAGRPDHAPTRPAAPGLRRGGDGRAGALDPGGRAAAAGRGPAGRTDPDGDRATSWSWGSGAGGPPRRPGWRSIPAIVRETDDTDMLRDALLENLHRSQLNPLEEAAAYAQLLEDFELHPRGAGRPDRPVPAPDQQHHPAAQALARRPAPGRRRRAVGRPRPVAAGGRGPRAAGPAGPARGRRGHQRPRPRGDRRRRRRRTTRRPRRPRAPSRRRPVWPSSPTGSPTGSRPGSRSTSAGAKGKITVEFASLDDLRRIVDIMDPR